MGVIGVLGDKGELGLLSTPGGGEGAELGDQAEVAERADLVKKLGGREVEVWSQEKKAGRSQEKQWRGSGRSWEEQRSRAGQRSWEEQRRGEVRAGEGESWEVESWMTAREPGDSRWRELGRGTRRTGGEVEGWSWEDGG